MLPRGPSAIASPLAPVNAPFGLGLRQAVIDYAHNHSSAVITRPTAARAGFTRVLISQSAGLVIVVPDHFSTLASYRRSQGMRKAPVVAGCLRLGLPVHVKMKNRLHRDKVATCRPVYTYGSECCRPCYRHPPSELQYSLQGFPRAPLEQKYFMLTSPPPSLGMAANTGVLTDVTSQSIQQNATAHTTGCRRHTACRNRVNTQQITEAAKRPDPPSNQHTIQPTPPTTPHNNTAHHRARHVTTTHYPPPTQYNTPQPITHYSGPQVSTTHHTTPHHMTRGHTT